MRAPSPTPEALSMYDVLDETPPAPPAIGGERVDDQDPLGVRRRAVGVEQPASAPIAVIVPMVSKKSASIRVKISSTAETTPTCAKAPNRVNVADGGEVGGVEDRGRPASGR